MSSLCKSNSKNSGSRGGATGSSSGSCCKSCDIRNHMQEWQMDWSTYICLKIWVGQSLLDSNPLLRVESLKTNNQSAIRRLHLRSPDRNTYQGLCQKVDSQWVGIREELRKWPAFAEGKCANVVPRTPCGDGVEFIECRRSQHIENQGELMVIIAPREERFPRQHLCEDASNRPHVDSLARKPDKTSAHFAGHVYDETHLGVLLEC